MLSAVLYKVLRPSAEIAALNASTLLLSGSVFFRLADSSIRNRTESRPVFATQDRIGETSDTFSALSCPTGKHKKNNEIRIVIGVKRLLFRCMIRKSSDM